MIITTGKIDGEGNQVWYNDKGQIHRINGPAIIEADGTEHWCIENMWHRDDGPAVIFPNGIQEWYQHGKCHRIDGPALIWPGGVQTWYLNNIHVRSKREFQLISGLPDEDMTLLILKYGEIK